MAQKTDNETGKIIINVDVIIKQYNKKNPEKRKLTRATLAEMLGVNKQLLSDWKSNKKPSPKWAEQLLLLIELGNCGPESFIYRSYE